MNEKIILEVKKAVQNSYSPYSKFKVGAVVETVDGKFIYGSNIENASYGATICAERSALVSAYSQGYKKEDIKAIALTSNQNKPISPCCLCRQVMVELLELSCPVYMIDENEVTCRTVDELVPYSFTKNDLIED